jgi:hypothetical protein
MATSRAFCYNPSQTPIPGTEQVGSIAAAISNVTIGAGQEWWNGPDEDPGYVVAYIDPTGDHPNAPERILGGNYICHIGFKRTQNKSEQEFIELARFLTGNPLILTGIQAKAELNNSGFWTSYGSLPSGMVLYLDAGVSNSYPGSGTTWYDLSGHGNHGTLSANTFYTNVSGGTMEFDGIGDYVGFNNPVEIPIGDEPYTISVWFNSSEMPSDRGFVGWGGFGNVNQVNAWRLRNNSSSTGFRHYWWGNDLDYDTPMTTSRWYHAVAAYQNGSRRLYLNNVLVAQDSPGGHNVTTSSNLRIGVTADFLNEWFWGKIAQVIIYKRQATIQEIDAIYNSGVIRFNNLIFGMYVNDMVNILGNSSEETNLLNFISNKYMNDLTFYMGSLLNDGTNRNYMRGLIDQIHNLGVSRVFSNVTQAVNCIDENNAGTEASFNNSSLPNERFDGFTQEWEFWNSNNPYGSFGAFINDDIAIANYCQAKNLTYDIYVSRCEDYAVVYTDQQVATHVVQYHDTIHLVAYITEATYTSNKGLSAARKTQLDLIGNAALQLGKVQRVSILWAAEGNGGVNMGSWFQNNTDLNAFIKFETEYNAWISSAKAGIELVGQKIYRYTGIKNL